MNSASQVLADESEGQASADIGTLASEIGIDHLVVINAPEYGSGFGPMQVHHVETMGDASEFVKYFADGDVVLVKASRAERFENLADEIQSRWMSREESEK